MTAPMSLPADWVPESCTLPTAERPLRVAEFRQLFESSLRAVEADRTSLRLLLDDGAYEEAKDLADRETQCCAFFAFRTIRSPRGVVLDIEVTDAHADVLRGVERMARAALAGAR